MPGKKTGEGAVQLELSSAAGESMKWHIGLKNFYFLLKRSHMPYDPEIPLKDT